MMLKSFCSIKLKFSHPRLITRNMQLQTIYSNPFHHLILLLATLFPSFPLNQQINWSFCFPSSSMWTIKRMNAKAAGAFSTAHSNVIKNENKLATVRITKEKERTNRQNRCEMYNKSAQETNDGIIHLANEEMECTPNWMNAAKRKLNQINICICIIIYWSYLCWFNAVFFLLYISSALCVVHSGSFSILSNIFRVLYMCMCLRSLVPVS